jgi:hypothetical protein
MIIAGWRQSAVVVGGAIVGNGCLERKLFRVLEVVR